MSSENPAASSAGGDQATKSVVQRFPVQKRKINELKPHPRQAEQFGDISDTELRRLAANMKRWGLLVPIEITPDGTIICGHQRVRAAELLGWTEIDVIVRDDLAAAGTDAILRRFLEDNDRRQLTPLQRASLIQSQWQLAQKARFQDGFEELRGALRDKVGRELKMSGRNLDRYMSALKAPVEVQKALEEHKLSLNDAARVAHLPSQKQQLIVAAIREGKKPADAVRAHLPTKPRNSVKPGGVLRGFTAAIRVALPGIRAQLTEVGSVPEADLQTLKDAQDVVSQLIQRAEAAKKKRQAQREELQDVATKFAFSRRGRRGGGQNNLIDDVTP